MYSNMYSDMYISLYFVIWYSNTQLPDWPKQRQRSQKKSSYFYLSCYQKPSQMYFLNRFLLIVLGIYKLGKLDYCAISYDCIAATVAHSIWSSFELLADESRDLSQTEKKKKLLPKLSKFTKWQLFSLKRITFDSFE